MENDQTARPLIDITIAVGDCQITQVKAEGLFFVISDYRLLKSNSVRSEINFVG